jgi:hypothetical protein
MVKAGHIAIIDGELFVSWKFLFDYDFGKNSLHKYCYEYNQGIKKSYRNIPINEAIRLKHRLDSTIKNMVAFASIPSTTRENKGLPHEHVLIQAYASVAIEQAYEEFRIANQKWHDLAAEYFRSNPKSAKLTHELADLTIWFIFLGSLKPTDCRELCGGSKDDLLFKAAEVIRSKNYHCFKIGGTSREKAASFEGVATSLRRRIKPFAALYKSPLYGQFKAEDLTPRLQKLLPKNIGNTNSEKLTEEQRALLFAFYADGDVKPMYTQIYNYYIQVANDKIQSGEWNADALVSLNTVKNFLDESEVRQAWTLKRHGKHEWRNIYETVTTRKRATLANALWIIDGTPAHFYYLDEDGNAYARLNVFVVLDAATWCVIGFYVDDSENHKQVIGALRNAVILSEGCIPHQIQSDNGSAVRGYFGRHSINTIAKYNTPARPGNARSKPVESFFKHFNSQVGRFYPGFTHSPVTGTHLNSKPNREALQAQLKEKRIVGKAAAINMLHEMFMVWNMFTTTDRPVSRLDSYKASIAETQDRQRKITTSQFVEAFYHMPGELKTIKGQDEKGNRTSVQVFEPRLYNYTNRGLQLKLADREQPITFQTDSPEFNAQYIGRELAVRIDLAKPDHVYLYELNAKRELEPVFINGKHMQLGEPFKFAQAFIDRTEGEAKALADHLSNKEKQIELVQSKVKRFELQALSAGVDTKLKPGNVFPKEVLNAAKAQIAESYINSLPATEKETKRKSLQMLEEVAEPIPVEVNQTEEPMPSKKIVPWYMLDEENPDRSNDQGS